MPVSWQEWRGGKHERIVMSEGGMWCCYGWWAGQVVNDWQHEQGGGARVCWEVSLISLSLSLGNLMVWGFEISWKCVYECVSLLCLHALEVPLQQKRGGGGWTCHFRGVAVMRWCRTGELTVRVGLEGAEALGTSIVQCDKRPVLCVCVPKLMRAQEYKCLFVYVCVCVCICVNATFESGHHCKI